MAFPLDSKAEIASAAPGLPLRRNHRAVLLGGSSQIRCRLMHDYRVNSKNDSVDGSHERGGTVRLTVSVIIPTMNRPVDLRRAIVSIVAQSRRPNEVIVVDDGNEDSNGLRMLFEGTGIDLVYFRKEPRGLCRSRNHGILASRGDVIVFIDDDVVMEPGYLEAFLRVFEADVEGRIGGLSGRIRRFKNGVALPLDHPRNWEDRLGRFFMFAPPRGGHVLPSGFRRSMLWPVGRIPVEFLQGGNMALRREVFEHTRFDESLDSRGDGYALGEDVQFSYPLIRRWSLYSIEDAVCEHWHAEGGRPDPYGMARLRIVHTWLFLKRFMQPTAVNYAAFAWAVFGIGLTSLLGMVVAPRSSAWSRLRGTIAGAFQLVRGGYEAPPMELHGLIETRKPTRGQ